MTYESIKSLIVKTAEEYKHSLGSDFRLVLREIYQLDDIFVNNSVEKNKATHFFSLKKGKKKYKVSTFVNKEVLDNSKHCFDNVCTKQVVKISVLAYWEVSDEKKELFEYHAELFEDDSIVLLGNNEYHDVYFSNCEDLRDKLIPSCDIISFFDILLLSLFRFAIPQLTKCSIWDEKIPLRNSLMEHIASEECFKDLDDSSAESEPEEKVVKKVARKSER